MRPCTDLASGGAEIVPLELGAPDARPLRQRHVQRQTASDDQRYFGHDSRRFHVAPRSWLVRGEDRALTARPPGGSQYQGA
jgi:hypothetical protein